MADIKVVGIEKLEKQLKENISLGAVKQAVKRSGTTLQKEVERIVPVDTGTLKRSITGPELTDGGLTAKVEATAEYAAYVEYGTRYMKAQPYMRPALEKAEKDFQTNMKKLVK
ncbi:HK97-gp10 family putative phage morphogenesis protein [Clostridium sp. C105KSO13]|uniref:HK97-gp10 family putative phage morphogenesis protein n=1 Tax=Clostridium sp. C105KSO13 TaxID=1776045 RepID=UPI000740848E|nr:HK97-gp10 family putative phage morphogenesis protein [Clostridium sp. C105KSO13]CUX18485.1 hypothetical protein BN3456_00288 [Clostridium sp. C105KSO13]